MSKEEVKKQFENLERAFKAAKLPVKNYAFWQEHTQELLGIISGERDERQNVYSVSKAFTAVAIAMAISEGKLKMEDKLIDFFPEFRTEASPGHLEITIKNLLQMQSGKKFPMFREHKSDTTEDYAKIFFSERLQSEPGKEFFYANLNSYMLGRVIEIVSGEKLQAYLEPRLFSKLGFEKINWQDCPNGHNLAYTGLELSIEQMLSFGKLLYAGGKWQGELIVPEEFVEAMHKDLVPSKIFPELETRNGYGYQVWKCCHKSSWRADGLYGQFILIYPEEKAIFACQTEPKEGHQAYDIIEIVNRELIESL